ncbi:MAG: sulfatase, partial [Planctomycetota bacterium]|nr:sulfatase [Planctomycetota bacterium]
MRPTTLIPLALLAACGGGGGSADGPSGPPNVILVTLDTTRPDYLSCYSEARLGTPTLQRIADEGTRFDAALSASGVTPVSHATILTGAFPYEHKLRVLSAGSGFKLPEEQRTIASALRERGYTTAAIQSAFPVSSYFGFQKDYDVFQDMAGEMIIDESQGKTIWKGDDLQRRSDHTAHLVLDFLDQAKEDEKPFFLWLHLWDPHDPWVLPPEEYTQHLDLRNPDEVFKASSSVYAQVYAAEIQFMDSQLGVVVAGLEERGLWDNSLMCVTADHGEGLADGMRHHGWSKHRMTYQAQLHVPLLLTGLGVPKGKTVPDMVRTADIVPTLLDLAGHADVFDWGSGRSLRPLLEGASMEPALAYADQVNGYDANASMVRIRPDAAFLYTICDGEWKLIFRPHMWDRSELFNLMQDPSEQHNQVDAHPEVFLRLMGELAARDPWVLSEFPIGDDFTEGVAEGLAEIGYGGGGGETGDW